MHAALEAHAGQWSLGACVCGCLYLDRSLSIHECHVCVCIAFIGFLSIYVCACVYVIVGFDPTPRLLSVVVV